MKSLRRGDQSIDWSEVKERLARVAEAMRVTDQPSAEETRRVLEARAKRLAQVPKTTLGAKEVLELLTFQLGTQIFAIETHFAREVLRSRAITPLPSTPAFLAGIANLRGEVLAVIQIGEFFALRAATEGEETSVIVLGPERAEFGLLVDAVREVSTWRRRDVLPIPSSLPPTGQRLLKGVTAEGTLVIDGAALLAEESLYVDQEDETPRVREE